MGLFDSIVSGQSSDATPLTKHEAFAGVLLATVASDGNISDDEADSFIGVVSRLPLFQEQSAAQHKAMMDKLFAILRRNGPSQILKQAQDSLPSELRESAFANAADLVFADGHVEDEEKSLLEEIQTSLGLSEALAIKIVEVIAIKNRG